MPVDDDEEEESDTEEYGLGPIGPTDEEINEYLRSISFEWCETVRRAGSIHREKDSISETAYELEMSIDKAREAVATYIHIYTYEGDPDADFTIVPGEEYGLRYFRDSKVDPENIFEDVAWEDPDSPEEVREKIRIFVAHQTKRLDLQEINLDQDIPQTPNRALPSTRAIQTIQEVNNQMKAATRIPVLQMSSLMKQWEDTIQNIMRPLIQSLQKIDFEAIREQQRIRVALEGGIYGFEPPSSYNPDTTLIDEETKSVGMTALENFISNVNESDIADLDDYINRLEYGLERFEKEDYIASTFVFLSVQDGFLDTINQQVGNQPSGSHYTYSDREEAFREEFPDVFGIQSADVAAQWGNFLDHRHKIMHGDPGAHLDENIASVALIFLVLAMYTTLELLNVD